MHKNTTNDLNHTPRKMLQLSSVCIICSLPRTGHNFDNVPVLKNIITGVTHDHQTHQ